MPVNHSTKEAENILSFVLTHFEKAGTSFHNLLNMRNSIHSIVICCIVLIAMGFQLIKTSLNVTVRDETGNTVAGATVQLFEKEEDYKAEQNVVMEGVTDEKGFLKLKELKAISYFVIVRKDDKDNSEGGEKTAKLEEKRMNKVTIIIQ